MKPRKPRKRAWWKFWQAPEDQAPKAIAYDPSAVQRGTVDPARKSRDEGI